MATFKHGSSPLARGLPGQGVGAGLPRRIIPARAGFTRRRSSRSRGPTDHPRSRGVYATPQGNSRPPQGSSPLARGLLLGNIDRALWRGIIPARAGFTRPEPASRPGGPDHPRSRGVYGALDGAHGYCYGSSPLARGLRRFRDSDGLHLRIIPARAGFTSRSARASGPSPDHPRSRGVYVEFPCAGLLGSGSSPLARGLHLRILGIPTTRHPTRLRLPSLPT